MKRLMITLSAAAMAFGLFADGVTLPVGEAFTGLTDVPASITSPGDSAISEVAYTLSKNAAGVPDQFVNEGAGNNLAIKTPFNAPAYYEPLTGGVSMNGLYFDSLVKFTACDEDAVVPDGSDAKIMVWVKEDETVGTTNLMVTAGYFNGDKTEAKIYDCGPLSDYDLTLDGTQWCRLTIKAYDEITTTGDNVGGFVLFVNAKTVTMAQDMEDRTIGTTGSYADSLTKKMALRNASYALFPSMAAADATTITGVGFAGQGAVDDLSFTDKAPTTDGEEAVFTDDPVPVIADVVVDGTPVVGATFDTAASIVDFVVNNCKTANKVEIALTDDCDALDFTDATCGEIVIDLAGKTIVAGENDENAIYSDVPLTIINTGDVLGSVTKSEKGENSVFGAENVTINDGIFNGPVVSGETLSINGGMFSEQPDDAVLPTNYIWVEPVDPEIYWTIREVQQFKVILVSNGEQSEQMIEEGKSLDDPGTPENVKAWQTFIGWFDENQQQVTFPLAITANTTLTAQNKFLDGEGTAAAPWQIETEDDLIKLQKYVAGGQTTAGKVFQQTANITLTKAWPGIGDYAKGVPSATQTYFAGVYDGNGKSISGLTFPTTGSLNQQGLFRKVYSTDGTAEIKDLTVNVNYDASDNNEAGACAVVGVLSNGKITRVTANGSIKGGHACAGIAGMVNGNAVFTDVTNNVAVVAYVNGNAKAGAMCNITQANSVTGTPKFIRCVNNAAIKGHNPSNGLGGLVGYNGMAIEIEDCELYGSYSKTDDSTADGKVGSVFGGMFDSCTAMTVKGTNKAVANVVSGTTAFDGLTFATVEGNIATFVKNAALAKNTEYKVMATGATATFELQAADDYIAFDHSLVGATYAITSATGVIETNDANNVITFTAKAAGPVLPAYIDPTDTTMVGKYKTWADKYGADTESANMEAFLLDCAPSAVEAAKAAFKVTSLTQDENGDWIAEVEGQGEGEAYKNGFIHVVPYTLEGAGDNAAFYQAQLLLKPVTNE